jgi:hypothetical protein
MGLDMYLTQKYYVQNWEHNSLKNHWDIKIMHGGETTNISTDKITYITTEVMYWRKANAIHKWFVENVQDGKDDCGEYYVSDEKLKELLNICTKILESSKLIKGKINNGYSYKNGEKIPIIEDGEVMENIDTAQELLPTTSGFFFGGTEYDEWYYRGLEDTKKELTKILSNKNDDDNSNFYYHSSW